jgi:hypothetical protein
MKGNHKHGCARNGKKTAEYRVWCAMRERCASPKHIEFVRYGGRGIRVCARWDDFSAFLADMGPRPSPEHSIERDDTDGHYEPANCRWATRSEQQRNKSTSIFLTLNGQTMHVLEWAQSLGLSINTIRKRLQRTHDAALVLRPSRQGGRTMTYGR